MYHHFTGKRSTAKWLYPAVFCEAVPSTTRNLTSLNIYSSLIRRRQGAFLQRPVRAESRRAIKFFGTWQTDLLSRLGQFDKHPPPTLILYLFALLLENVTRGQSWR